MSSSRFDPSPPDRSSTPAERQTGSSTQPGKAQGGADAAGGPPGVDLLSLIGRAEQISRDYQQRTIQRPLARSYRAWQNQHAEGSKYLGTAWKGRSRLFVPKTRSAVRKNLATAAGALFSTEDVVNISAQFEDDPQQRAAAAVIKADVDYRLTCSSLKSGIPWYQIALGGCLDGQLTGITISKQFWEYEEVETGKTETVQVHDTHPDSGEPLYELAMHPDNDEPLLDANGAASITPVLRDEQRPVMRVVKDRPMIELMPIENAGIDPAAPWYSPVQLGAWFYMRFPMRLTDVRAMMSGGGGGGRNHSQGWLDDITDEMLLKGRIEEDRSGTRRLREGGSDRYEDARVPGELDIVWIQENFLRIEGKDYHFWSIGRHHYLSIIQETRDAYPELDGERPYVFGVSQLDTHRVFPQSPVETWQPLQLELNDIANLRLDSLKRSIAPLAIIRRGKNVDIPAVQRRGQPDAMILVDAPDDVTFESTPGPSGAAYTETSVTNASFDELAGVFSTSSVQTDRQLNETVGGMRLMSGAANSVSEFDLRMWVETWVEPALRQIVHLVRHNESDERILAVAGQRARVWQRYQYMPTLSDFTQTDITLRVNVGIGALDPMQRLGKLKMAAEMLAPMFPLMQKKGITPNVEAFIEEVMGHAGFKDGRRFFDFGQPQPPQPPPEVLKEQAKAQAQAAIKQKEIDARLQIDAADNRTKLEVAALMAKREMIGQVIDALAEREARAGLLGSDREARHADFIAQRLDHAHDFASQHAARVHETRVGQQNSAADRKHRLQEIFAKQGADTGSDAGGDEGGAQSAGAGRSPRPTPGNGGDDMLGQIMSRLDQQAQRQSSIEDALKAIVSRMAPQGGSGAGLGALTGTGA